MSLLSDDNLDSQVRGVLAKHGDMRSYDDLLVLKSRISKMDFMKSVFSSLHPRQIDELCRSMNLEAFEENTFVFHQGDVGDKFYVVLSGSCDVLLKQRTGKYIEDPETGGTVEEFVNKVIFTCRPGGQFGERALDFDEPRAASIKTTCYCELITITQTAYRKMLKAPVHESALDLPGNKGHTLRVLSLTRDKRKVADLHAVSEYLSTHVPFFKKFTKDQRLEMCRMCELVKIWGKTVLFKQGSVGQAFYIILTGSVDVVVSSVDANGAPVDIHVNSLHEGSSFGERSLESADSLRTATIVTSDALTELIIISREEYQRIVTVMREGDMMERVQLLRNTQIFSTLELPHLHEIAKVMESKIFRLDSKVFTIGDIAKEVYFIHKGECHLDCVLTKQNGQKEVVELGRMGPGAVLGEYCLLADSYYDEVVYKESAMATTYCCSFVLSKIDVFHAISEETRIAVIEAIKNFIPPTTALLWDTCPNRKDEKDLRISQTWKHFQEAVAFKKDSKGILDYYRGISNRGMSKSNGGGHQTLDMACKTSLSPRYKVPRTLVEHHSPRPMPRFDLSPRYSKDSTNTKDGDRQKKYSVLKSAAAPVSGVRPTQGDLASNPPKEIHLRGELGTNSTIQELPFSLVQIHRDVMAMPATKDVRRGIRCFLRLCGSMSTGLDAKAAADAQLCNSAIKFKSFNLESKTHRAGVLSGLEWKRFNGFENVPFQHTDHFIIMCRSVPVEFCSFTPTCNLMEMSFPPSCKLRLQKYGCVSTNDLKKPTSDSQHASAIGDIADALMPLYSREMACIAEIHAVTHTRVECLRFAVLGMNGKVQAANTTLLVVPLYSWLLISEELITNYSCSEYTKEAVTTTERSILEKMERNEGHGKKFMTSKTATDELRVALQGFGVGGLRQYHDDDEVEIPDASRGMLYRDLKTRKLMDEVEKRFAISTSNNKLNTMKDDNKDPKAVQGKRPKAPSNTDDKKNDRVRNRGGKESNNICFD